MGEVLLICMGVAVARAAATGLAGFEDMSLPQRLLIFSILLVLATICARELVADVTPGSRHALTSSALLSTSCAALLVVFSLLFHDYHTEDFVSAGLACLRNGVLHAIPIALLGWLVLRRGFVTNPVSAGMSGGVLGGLGGVTMLELHCNNFQALHILIWHTGVVLVSAVGGAVVMWAIAECARNSDST
jgi:hypothetical protein